MKPKRDRKVTAEVQDEHELLQQEDFDGLAELRETVSPYWASRLVYQPARER
jgi:hypothetical protein